MSRVSNSEVEAIVDTKRDVTPFVENANLVVNENLANKGLTDDRLKLVELYLAAHFVAVTEERGALTEVEGSNQRETYEIEVQTGFGMTRYGQQAMALDTTQTLSNLSKNAGKRSARFTVV
jgi:hypothetical protein